MLFGQWQGLQPVKKCTNDGQKFFSGRTHGGPALTWSDWSLEKAIYEKSLYVYVMVGLECSTICSRDMDIDSYRQKKIRSLWNMEEKNDKCADEEVLRRVKQKQANTELDLAEESSMD